MIKVYTRERCPKCHELIKNLKNTRNEEIIEINIEKDFELTTFLREKGVEELPVMELDGMLFKKY